MKRVIFAGVLGLMILLFILCVLTQLSCKKQNKFIGIYVGSDTSTVLHQPFGAFIPDTVSIAAGSSNNSFIISQSPFNSLTLNATPTGDTIRVPAQTVTNIQGQSLTWTAEGTLTGNLLSVTFHYNTTPDTSYTFIGEKQ